MLASKGNQENEGVFRNFMHFNSNVDTKTLIKPNLKCTVISLS